MTKVVIVAAALLLTLSFSSALSNEALTAGHVPGRSSNVFFYEGNTQTPTARVTFVDPAQKFIASTQSIDAPLSSVADLMMSAATGASSPLSSAAPFTPNAVFLLTVHGADDLDQCGTIRSLLSQKSVTCPVNFAPSDDVSVAASLASGQSPRQTGIAGATWETKSGIISAFTAGNDASFSRVATVADVFAQAFEGQSLTVSASAHAQLAHAHAPRPSLRSRNNRVAVFDSRSQAFTGVDGVSTVTKAALLEQMRSQNTLWSSSLVQFNVDAMTATVGSVTFDLNNQAHFLVFAEMQFLHGVLRSLQQEPAVHDSVPDLITLSSYALANLANNGASLDLINAAHTVVDAGVAALVSAMSTLYADRYVAVIAALPSLRTASLADRVMVPLNKLLTKHNVAVVSSMFAANQAMVRTKSDTLRAVCQELRSAIAPIQVQCFTDALSTTAFLESASHAHASLQAVIYPVSTATVADQQRYQIILWLSLGLAFILLGTIYSLGYMDLKKDTLLYSKFNPNWKHVRA